MASADITHRTHLAGRLSRFLRTLAIQVLRPIGSHCLGGHGRGGSPPHRSVSPETICKQVDVGFRSMVTVVEALQSFKPSTRSTTPQHCESRPETCCKSAPTLRHVVCQLLVCSELEGAKHCNLSRSVGELMSMSGPQQESRNARVMLALMVPGVCIYPVCDLACEFCDLNSLVVRTISISLPIISCLTWLVLL